jgi:hypothetical protein
MNVIGDRECGSAEEDQSVAMKKGWQTKKLGDVATLQRGFDLPTQERIDGDIPLVTSSGITDTVDKSAVHGPGVATGRSGSIGKVFYIDQDFWPLNTVLYVKDFHGNDTRFIFYMLRMFDLNRFATGTGVPTLNRNFVHDEIVNVPPLPEQQRIVALLSAGGSHPRSTRRSGPPGRPRNRPNRRRGCRTRYEHEGRAMREHDLLIKTCFSSTHALPIPDTFSRLAQQASAYGLAFGQPLNGRRSADASGCKA